MDSESSGGLRATPLLYASVEIATTNMAEVVPTFYNRTRSRVQTVSAARSAVRVLRVQAKQHEVWVSFGERAHAVAQDLRPSRSAYGELLAPERVRTCFCQFRFVRARRACTQMGERCSLCWPARTSGRTSGRCAPRRGSGAASGASCWQG